MAGGHSNLCAPEILRDLSGGALVNGVQGRGDLEHRNSAPRSKPLVALWSLSVHTERDPPPERRNPFCTYIEIGPSVLPVRSINVGKGGRPGCAAPTAYVRKRREGQAPPLFTAPLPKEGRLFCTGSAGSANGGAAAKPHSLVSFHPAQGPVARREFRHPLQSPRAGNFAGPPRRGPRKRGPGARRLGAPERCSPEQAPGGSLVPFCPYRKGPAAGAAESLLYVYRNRAVRSACSIHKCGQGRAAQCAASTAYVRKRREGQAPPLPFFRAPLPKGRRRKRAARVCRPYKRTGRLLGFR